MLQQLLYTTHLRILAALGILSAVCSHQDSSFHCLARAATLTLPKLITSDVSIFVERILNGSAIPGVSLGVVRLNHTDKQPVVELAAWGRRTEEGDGHDLTPLTPDTLFALASCSKAFLVTSIGLLMDDYALGRNATPLPISASDFHWDTKIQDLLPDEWTLWDKWANTKTTIRDALGHVTGLPRHDYSYRPGDTAQDVLRRLRHLPPAWDLREKWSYNNLMYIAGARIVEKYANMSIGDFVTSRIFKPLHMTSSTYSPSEAAWTGRVTQTWTRGVRRIPYWFPDEVNNLFAGPGGAVSSAEDIIKWVATLLNGGIDPKTNATIVPASVLANMTAYRAIENTAVSYRDVVSSLDVSAMGYGMGWFRMMYKECDVVWHFGAIPGFSLLVAFLPTDNLGAVILANMDEKQNDTMSILFHVIDKALNLPPSNEHTLEDQPMFQNPIIQIRDSVEAPLTDPLPLDLEAYIGSYTSVAYGNITFCGSNSTSAHCAQVLATFAPIVTATGEPLPDARLYAAWPRVWSSHVRLRHASGNTFGLVFPWLFPQGFGANRTAFEFYDSVISVGRVEFLVERGRVLGFALVTQEEAAAARKERTNGSVQEIGDAWFVKVE
ncbi:beta-lactamase/transpeptidase-like protein [Lenzites betulinus]|nr:beta-lactamase/transpeptidase-like protein [Lenzites betulinus]